jgi:UDP-N-acetylmuramoyl-L-alanyl-D-glutamate--2,6-diaminopimelate ligase
VDLSHVTADSRAVRPGSLFVAISGRTTDGAAYIADAVARGAAAVMAPPGAAWPAGTPPRPLVIDPEPRRRLALIAAEMAGAPPDLLVAVTGTNGKTSTVDFLRQFWTLSGRNAASVGTLGVIAPNAARGPAVAQGGAMTTPDPVELSLALAELARRGVGAVALEASSHGLDQFRLDGLRFAAAAFTNLTRDHLDYHGDMAAYRAAKLRLFTLLQSGAPAVASSSLDADSLEALRQVASRRRLDLRVVGEDGDWLRLLRAAPTAEGMAIEFTAEGGRHEATLALPGRFQVDNLLVAAGLAHATGTADVWALLPRLVGVRGRMELAARLPNGAAAYVDYAHTPDALERLLTALRPHARRLVAVFGAGGDRDRGKRPLMGEVCARLADRAIVTDDNPRSEDPAAIRREVLAGCPGGVDGGARSAAIATGLSELGPGDVLVVAGKGHEQGQTIAGVTYPFDDATEIRRLAGLA